MISGIRPSSVPMNLRAHQVVRFGDRNTSPKANQGSPNKPDGPVINKKQVISTGSAVTGVVLVLAGAVTLNPFIMASALPFAVTAAWMAMKNRSN